MSKYIKKPVAVEAVEAIEWTGSNHGEANDFTYGDLITHFETRQISVRNIDVMVRVNVGDFIVKGINGEFYPCKPGIFKKTYYTEKEYAELN